MTVIAGSGVVGEGKLYPLPSGLEGSPIFQYMHRHSSTGDATGGYHQIQMPIPGTFAYRIQYVYCQMSGAVTQLLAAQLASGQETTPGGNQALWGGLLIDNNNAAEASGGTANGSMNGPPVIYLPSAETVPQCSFLTANVDGQTIVATLACLLFDPDAMRHTPWLMQSLYASS